MFPARFLKSHMGEYRTEPKWRNFQKAHQRILDEGWATQKDIDEIYGISESNVKTAIEIAESEKAPDPYSHEWSAYSSSNFNK